MIVVVCVLCLLSVCKLETFTTVLDIIRRVIVLACVVLSHPVCVPA